MYDINDKEAATRRVQRYLSKIYENEITISETGFLDKNTLLALNKFQNENGLKERKSINYANYTLLYERFINANGRHKQRDKTVIYPLTRGNKHPEIYNINYMLSNILKHYGHFVALNVNDYFSEETEKALKIANNIFGFEDTDYIDELLHSRIIIEWNSINKAEYFP